MSDFSENFDNTQNVNNIKDIYEIVESVVSALVIVILLLSFCFRIVSVHGTSMVPTLHDQDKVVISHLFHTPKTGDVVVLDSEIDETIQVETKTLIKRIIATEGQVVDIDKESGEVSVDGVVLDEDYIAEMINPSRIGDQEYPLTVPENMVFVMGDNRNGSADSRLKYIGLIDKRFVIGKVYLRILPVSDFKMVK